MNCVFCENEVNQVVTHIILTKTICEKCWFLIASLSPHYCNWKTKMSYEDGRAVFDKESKYIFYEDIHEYLVKSVRV